MKFQDLSATELLNTYKAQDGFSNDVEIRQQFLNLIHDMTTEEREAFAKYDEFAFILAIEEIFKDAPQEQQQIGNIIAATWKYMDRNSNSLASPIYDKTLTKEICYIIDAGHVHALLATTDSAQKNLRGFFTGGGITSDINNTIKFGMKESSFQALIEKVEEVIDSIKAMLGMEVEQRTKFTVKQSVIDRVMEGMAGVESKVKDLDKTITSPWVKKIEESKGKGGQDMGRG